jgi:hypothetical protein
MTSLSKIYQDPISVSKKLGLMVHTCYPSYVGSINTRILVQAGLSLKAKTLFKNN